MAWTTPSLATLIVSFTGMAGAAAPRVRAVSMVCSKTSGGRKGRAPSWMATRSALGSAACKPSSTDSVRLAPPLTMRVTLCIPSRRQRSPMGSIRSSRVTMTISSTESEF